MNDKNQWQIDHYRGECYITKTKLKRLEMYIRFLEEKYRIRTMEDFKEEFNQWIEQHKLK